MRSPQGLATIVGDLPCNAPTIIDQGIPDATRHFETEIDTFTCGHCCRIVHVPVRASPSDIGGLCKQCMELICPQCVDKMVCTPWEQEMERREAVHRFRKSAGLYERG